MREEVLEGGTWCCLCDQGPLSALHVRHAKMYVVVGASTSRSAYTLSMS